MALGPPRPPDRGPLRTAPTPGPYRGGITPRANISGSAYWAQPTPAATLAQAQALAAAQQSPDYASIQENQAYAQRVYDAHMAQQQAILHALSGFLGGIGGPITHDYSGIAKSQIAYAKGYSTGMQLLAQGQANQSNAYLQNIVGAPQGQMIPASQATQAGDVLMGVGGTIPAEQFKAQGAAYGAAAAQFQPIAAANEHITELGIQSDYQQASDAFAAQLRDLARQNPVITAQFLNDLYNQQRADRQDAIAAQQYRDQMNAQQAQAEAQARAQAQAAATAQSKYAYQVANNTAIQLTRSSSHVYIARQNRDGSWGVADVGAKVQKPTSAPHLVIRTTPQGTVAIDPTTGNIVKVIAPPGAPKPTKPTTFQGTDGRTYRINPATGVATVVPGQPGPKPKAGTRGTVPTPNQLNTMITKWYQGAISRSTSTNSKTGATTTTTTQSSDPITYQQALQKLLALRVPRDQALKLLNSTWKRGEYGRPWLNADARAALAKANQRPAVNYAGVNINKAGVATKKIPYLTAAQVAALKAVGLLPPGEWAQHPGYTRGPVYVISASY